MMKGLAFLTPVSCLLILACSSSPELARWEFTGGPSGQNISTVFVDEHNRSHLLAGLATGDIYTSMNGGIAWSKLTTLQASTVIHRFIQRPDNPRHFFAATSGGLFLSTDEGKSWTHITVDQEIPRSQSRVLAIEPYNTQVMYTGLPQRGIYKSADGGATWKQCTRGLDSVALLKSDVFDIVIDPLKPDNVYAALKEIGVVKSTDAGVSWIKLTSIIGSGGVAPTSIVVHPKSAGTLCFGMAAGSIYKSVDGGQTWSPTRFGSGSNTPVRLLADPGNPGSLYAGTENEVSASTDFGTTWKSISGGLPHVATAIALAPGDPSATLFAYGEGIGLNMTSNGGASWVPIRDHLGGSTVTAITGNKRGDVLFAAVGSSVHKWTRQTQGWTSASNGLTGGDVAAIAVDTDSSSVIHAATADGVFTTSDGGALWGPGSPQMRGRSMSLIATHPIFGTRILAESQKELFASTDKGVSWNPTKPLNAKYHVNAFTFSHTDAGFVLGATEQSGVLLSTNGGLTWEKNQYGLEANNLTALTLDDQDKQTLYAWTDRGRGFRSTNKGLVWDRYSPPWMAGERVYVTPDHFKPSSVIAFVHPAKIYYSASGGATWFPIQIDPLQGDVVSTYWDAQRSEFFVGVKDGGVYRLSLGEYLKRLFTE